MLQRLVELLSGQSLAVGGTFVFTVLLLCGFGLPMPEDVVLVTGGILAWLSSPIHAAGVDATFQTMIRDEGFLHMVLIGLGGIVAGDSVIYWVGRLWGRHVAEHRFLRRIITPEKLEKVETLLRRRGKVVVIVARYLPGLRAPTYFTVGHSRLPFWEFVIFDGLAALVSAPLWVALGFWFGSDIERAAREAGRLGHYLLAGVALLLAFLAARWLLARRNGRRESPGVP